MSTITNNLSTPVVLACRGPRVEVLPLGYLRRLRSTLTFHRLVTFASAKQVTVYDLDVQQIEADYVAQHGRHQDDARHVAAISAALLHALVEGQPVPVIRWYGRGMDAEMALE